MTTKEVYNHLRNHYQDRVYYYVENTYCFHSYYKETDLLLVQNNRYCIDIEVKTSRSDFLADKKKIHKHSILKNGYFTVDYRYGGKYEVNEPIYTNNRPNKFFYCCPENLIKISEIPNYAGLIYVLESGERTKSLQLIHYQYKKDKTTFSTIGLNSITQHLNGNHYDMVTLGANAKHYWEHFGVFGSVYYQVGKNSLAQSKSAYQFSLNADVLLGQHNIVLGTEWLSGTDFDEDTSKNHSFSPFYGTNHKFNGFMNYFFVGNHFNSVGLKDFYIKSNFKFNPKATHLSKYSL